ncbi:hypothetical protein EVJ58_g8500 [Rhodofomes roseus]|uniref:Mediator of RNA polymerase II transcription subunit 13 n=1 Tax=Rhodofomes roseus TaxID=34475 RepID=A0A4Y9XY51_9APHY|nr:hypothetical protein EVJ58_g8500 [Rhodofomes roseus]
MAASKPLLASQDNTGSTFLAQCPPHISTESPVLASAVTLPEYPLIAYTVFSGDPSTKADNLNSIEHARRHVLSRNEGRDILNSLLPAVHISKDASALYVFAFGSLDRTSETQSALAALQLDDLLRPTSALTSQFQEALLGLGAGDWKCDRFAAASREGFAFTAEKSGPTYVIAWLSVQNKQGEDKGMPIIWPMRLCLSYHSTSPSAHARTPLPYIPELPTQLQASPPPPMPVVPAALANGQPGSTSSRNISRDGTPSQTGTIPPDQGPHPATMSRRPAPQRSSATVDSLRAFRGMTLISTPSTRSLHTVANEVSGYVDSVAKERERERERMKREKESANIRARTNSFSGAPVASSPPQPEVGVTPEPQPAAESQQNVEPAPEATPLPNAEETPMEQDGEPLFPSSQGSSSTDSLFSPAEEGSPPPTDDVAPAVEEAPMQVDTEPAGSQPSQPEPSTVISQDGLAAYDPFAGFGDNMNSWAGPSSNDFLGVDMGLGMDFNVGMGAFGNSRSGAGVVGDFDMDDGLGVFTEDDFSFFDAPSVQNRVTAPVVTASVENVIKAGEGLTPTAGPAPLGFSPQRVGDGAGSSSPGPPTAVFSNRSSWPQGLVTDGLTPHLFGGTSDIISPAPDLIPPSPTRTTSTQSAPATPSVQICDTQEGPLQQKGRYLGIGPSIFDPIPFALGHRIADSKYAFGKFALPSPPDTDDRVESMNFSPANGGWIAKYSAATDPRIGVMKKLVEFKRKGFDQSRASALPTWGREYKEWEGGTTSLVDDDEAKSESESEDEEVLVDEDPAAAIRPSTPPPSYLPLGPTLLQTRFHHGRLLPLSGPLRPPGSAVNSATSGPAPVSAPTPVSPAAVLGATSEKSKSLEAAVQILVKEIVENNVWAEAWHANAAAASMSLKPPCEVWQTDVKRVGRLLESIKATQSPLALQQYCSPVVQCNSGLAVSLHALEPPMLTIGKSDSVIQVLPAALRFWEKIGLGPRAGRKDVTAFVVFEGSSERKEVAISQWLDKISATYSAKNYGTHTAGMAPMCTKAGLVPVQFDSLKKTLVKFVSGLPTSAKNAHVFYIVAPSSVVALDSPLLRQLFSAVKRCTKTYPDFRILFHFVPEAFPAGALSDPRYKHEGLESFVAAVYDRLLQPVERPVSPQLAAHIGPTRAFFQAPAFSLASALPGRKSSANHRDPVGITFMLESHPRSLDVVNRHMLFHVGYSVTPCKRWLLAAGVDERGDSHELGAWLLPDESVDAFIVKQVWSFARTCTARASVEWRVSLAKLGSMSATELNAWMFHLDSIFVNNTDAPPMRVMLLTVEHQRSLTVLAPSDGHRPASSYPSSTRSPPRGSSGHVFTDTMSTTYALFPPAHVSCNPALGLDPMGGSYPGSLDLPFVQDAEDEGPPAYEQSAMRGLARSLLINVPAGTDYTSINSIEIIQLHSICSRNSTSRAQRAADGDAMVVDDGGPVDANADDACMLRDLTHNYHALAVLAQARWQPRDHAGLPLHLSALEAMKMALSGGSADAS